jgi:ABC-type lipoprotein export system ATPase subunit
MLGNQPPNRPVPGASSLCVERLCKSFGDRVVLDGLDLTIERGESVAIVGPSGSGKSTLLNLLGSLERPDSGRILLGEIDLNGLGRRELEQFRSLSVGFVFQEHLLLPHLTALDNVLLPCLGRREPVPVEMARKLLDRMGLASRELDFPSTLSGGERQRVAFARALIHEPLLVLADEPTGSLDHVRGEELVELLRSEAEDRDRIVIMATHNLDLAYRFDRTLSLNAGKLVPEAV